MPKLHPSRSKNPKYFQTKPKVKNIENSDFPHLNYKSKKGQVSATGLSHVEI